MAVGANTALNSHPNLLNSANPTPDGIKLNDGVYVTPIVFVSDDDTSQSLSNHFFPI